MKKLVFLSCIYFLFACNSYESNDSIQRIIAVCQINPANGSAVNGKAKFVQKKDKVSLTGGMQERVLLVFFQLKSQIRNFRRKQRTSLFPQR